MLNTPAWVYLVLVGAAIAIISFMLGVLASSAAEKDYFASLTTREFADWRGKFWRDKGWERTEEDGQ